MLQWETDVSIILPIYNAELWLDECLQSILNQKHDQLRIELSAWLDSCTDNSESIFHKWSPRFKEIGIKVLVSKNITAQPKGVGYSKNQAVCQSSGHFLCFMDADDIMEPLRIQEQFGIARNNQDAIVGSKFKRIPENSTIRFTKWANTLSDYQLKTQVYTSHGPTVIMPTWFCHRSVYDRVGCFNEGGKGVPEDLIFFYQHLRLGGNVLRSDQQLLIYRYHPDATTFSIHEETIWQIRVKEIQDRILSSWSKFSIWNAGKQGRKFFRSLWEENRSKVSCFCDVDVKKIGSFYIHEESEKPQKQIVPIIHYKDVQPPFIICVKMDMTGGSFEENLKSLQLEEGKDYYHFN